ncbi:hypothetical protein ETAA8_11720 [Anatilimnocola aggregata]|uniref:Uncharacterized protein n=1 Tax=Anatilimnocola aggregata TaxID=2528021 RepID=A0A517Y785_9BACT|nr:hypothetical protein [Anatilimnocola aggregata]QDU26098.1 hypothetical protein ETAA8_11720 [Anatilimnocola aggregata]
MKHSLVSLGTTLVLGSVSLALAQEVPARPYDGIQAGLDAYQLGEERRQANVQAQIQANDAARASAGLPTTRGETIYYYGAPTSFGYRSYGVVPWDTAYAYGGFGAAVSYGRFGRRAVVFGTGPFVGGPAFSPWPYIPGDIYGYQTQPMVRQPIGQRQVQTGENTWESHPVYDPPLPNRPVLPPVDSPLLNNTPFATQPPAEPLPAEPIPSPGRSNTARDF